MGTRLPGAKHINILDIETFFPKAIAAMGLTAEELSVNTDCEFYVHEGVLYEQSHDERLAFYFIPQTLEWEEVDWPLEIPFDPSKK